MTADCVLGSDILGSIIGSDITGSIVRPAYELPAMTMTPNSINTLTAFFISIVLK